jgi:hypothetical protein
MSAQGHPKRSSIRLNDWSCSVPRRSEECRKNAPRYTPIRGQQQVYAWTTTRHEIDDDIGEPYDLPVPRTGEDGKLELLAADKGSRRSHSKVNLSLRTGISTLRGST